MTDQCLSAMLKRFMPYSLLEEEFKKRMFFWNKVKKNSGWEEGVLEVPLVAHEASSLNWGTLTEYSFLWWFLAGEEEVKVSNGFLDWRNSQNYNLDAEAWARFVDTSAYFIEVLLMNEANIDTDYNPILF